MTTPLLLLGALLAQPAAAPAPRAGEVHEIRLERIFQENATDGSETSSTEEDRFVERVIGVREGGVELEFDHAPEVTAETRALIWQFPVRALRVPGGALQLLNGPEVEARLARWRERSRWPQSLCGRMVYTWNAFRIECEPQSAVRALALNDLPATELRDGAPYRDPLGLGPAALQREASPSGGAAYTATLPIDAEAAQRERAEADMRSLALGGGTPEENAALRAEWAAMTPRSVAGTIRIRFETDAAGRMLRRTRVTELRTDRADGVRETRTVTETVERRLVSQR